MNDKEIWNKYYANDLAEYAIASHTLGMLIKSYNKKYNLNISCEYDSNGYVIQYNDNNDKKFDSNDNLYAIKNTDKSWEYCVGTRAKDNISASLYDISQEGSIQVDACWKDTVAIRLVVCLKSNVMTKKYSGTWIIS